MEMSASEHLVTTIEQLEALYGQPYGPAVFKEIDHISSGYRKLIEAAPFVAVATGGPEGLDCSPKGDAPASCVSSTTRRSPSPTGPATTALTATATSCAIRASRCCFSFPASAKLCGRTAAPRSRSI